MLDVSSLFKRDDVEDSGPELRTYSLVLPGSTSRQKLLPVCSRSRCSSALYSTHLADTRTHTNTKRKHLWCVFMQTNCDFCPHIQAKLEFWFCHCKHQLTSVTVNAPAHRMIFSSLLRFQPRVSCQMRVLSSRRPLFAKPWPLDTFSNYTQIPDNQCSDFWKQGEALLQHFPKSRFYNPSVSCISKPVRSALGLVINSVSARNRSCISKVKAIFWKFQLSTIATRG